MDYIALLPKVIRKQLKAEKPFPPGFKNSF